MIIRNEKKEDKNYYKWIKVFNILKKFFYVEMNVIHKFSP